MGETGWGRRQTERMDERTKEGKKITMKENTKERKTIKREKENYKGVK